MNRELQKYNRINGKQSSELKQFRHISRFVGGRREEINGVAKSENLRPKAIEEGQQNFGSSCEVSRCIYQIHKLDACVTVRRPFANFFFFVLLAAHIILHSISSISRLRSSCANSLHFFLQFVLFRFISRAVSVRWAALKVD